MSTNLGEEGPPDMRAVRRHEPLFDLGIVIIVLCAMSLVAIAALRFADYPVPMWADGVVLSLCVVVALVIGVGLVRRRRS